MLHDSKCILIAKQPYNIHSHISDSMSHPETTALAQQVNGSSARHLEQRGASRALPGQRAAPGGMDRSAKPCLIPRIDPKASPFRQGQEGEATRVQRPVPGLRWGCRRVPAPSPSPPSWGSSPALLCDPAGPRGGAGRALPGRRGAGAGGSLGPGAPSTHAQSLRHAAQPARCWPWR